MSRQRQAARATVGFRGGIPFWDVRPSHSDRRRRRERRDLRVHAEAQPDLLTAPRYNIRPTQDLPVIRRGEDGALEHAELRWWLIPSWSRKPSSKFPTFNARADSVTDKASSRAPFKNRRCLVVVDGFYEWPKKPSKDKCPRWIRFVDRRAFTLAGLWDRRVDRVTGLSVDSCTVITTEANEMLESVPHDRMPVFLDGEARDRWLAVDAGRGEVQSLLVARDAGDMEIVITSEQFVNHGIDDERIEPAA